MSDGSRSRPNPPRILISALALVAAGLVLAAPATPAGTVEAREARIVRVTTFPDRAEVAREARLNVPAGPSTIEFPGLPRYLEPDSLRATARGVPAALGAVELKPEAREPEESPEFLAAQGEVRRIESEIGILDADSKTATDMREFLKALRATTAARESERMGEGRADPASIQAVFDMVRNSLNALNRESMERREQRRRLAEELTVARARLEATRPKGPVRFRTATVEVEARQAGLLTVQLEYLAPRASWRPAYRASLDAGTGRIDLASEAVVRQQTGEDWSGVELRLSTASPARGVKPPELPPWLLRPIQLRVGGGNVAYESEGMRPVAAMEPAPEKKSKGKRLGDGGADLMQEAERLQAGIVLSGYNLAFQVPGSSDVLSDGNDHRVGLRQDQLEGEIRYRAVPALNAAAFLVAKTKAPAGYPLLAGPVRVFAGGAYLGSFVVEETGPGAEVTLPFGIDNRVTVDRVPLPLYRERGGIFGRERRISYGFRTTIENLRDRKITVLLEDRVPVSEDERIRVEIDDETTPGAAEVEDRPGIREWSLEIEPGGKADVILAYTIRFPREMVIPGID